jgi:heme-degrading monooxygenase HmoA
MKAIIITTIKTKLSQSEVMDRAEARAGHLTTVPGLLRKFWCYAEKDNRHHGIFEFESKQHAEEYLKTEFAKSVAEVYETTEPVQVKLLTVWKEQPKQN